MSIHSKQTKNYEKYKCFSWEFKRCKHKKYHMLYTRWRRLKRKDMLCSKWRNSFYSFAEDVAEKYPAARLDGWVGVEQLRNWTLVRKANNHNVQYTPSNTVWATRTELGCYKQKRFEIPKIIGKLKKTKKYDGKQAYRRRKGLSKDAIRKYGTYTQSYVRFNGAIISLVLLSIIMDIPKVTAKDLVRDVARGKRRKIEPKYRIKQSHPKDNLEHRIKNYRGLSEYTREKLNITDPLKFGQWMLGKVTAENRLRRSERVAILRHPIIPRHLTNEEIACRHIYYDDPKTGRCKKYTCPDSKLPDKIGFTKNRAKPSD